MSAISSCTLQGDPIVAQLDEYIANKNYLGIFHTLDTECRWTYANPKLAGRYIRKIHFKGLLNNKDLVYRIYEFFTCNRGILERKSVVKHFIAELDKSNKHQSTRRLVFFLSLLMQCEKIPTKYLLPAPEQEDLHSIDSLMLRYTTLNEHGSPLQIKNNGCIVANLWDKEISSVIKISNFVRSFQLKKCILDATVRGDFSPNRVPITPRFDEFKIQEFFLTCKLGIFPFTGIIVTGNTISESTMHMLVEAINENSNITSLKLKHCNITPEAAIVLAKGLRDNRSIKALCLADNPLNGFAVEELLSSTLLNKVKTLDLRYIPIDERTITSIRTYGELSKKLTKIILSREGFSEENLFFIHSVKRDLPYLYEKEGGKCYYVGNEKLSRDACIYSFDIDKKPCLKPLSDSTISIFNRYITQNPPFEASKIRPLAVLEGKKVTFTFSNNYFANHQRLYLIDHNLIMVVAGETEDPNNKNYYLYQPLHHLSLQPKRYKVSIKLNSHYKWTYIDLIFD